MSLYNTMKKLSSTFASITIIGLMMGSVNAVSAAEYSMPAPMTAGLLRAVLKPVQVVTKGTARIVKKTVSIATKPVRVLTH